MNKIDNNSYTEKFMKEIKEDLKSAYEGVENRKLIDNFIFQFKAKILEKGVELGKYIYCFNTRGGINKDVISIDVGNGIFDGTFNVLLLDVDNNKTYFFNCDLENINCANFVNSLDAKEIMSILEGGEDEFKRYILDILSSIGFDNEKLLKLVVKVFKDGIEKSEVFKKGNKEVFSFIEKGLYGIFGDEDKTVVKRIIESIKEGFDYDSLKLGKTICHFNNYGATIEDQKITKGDELFLNLKKFMSWGLFDITLIDVDNNKIYYTSYYMGKNNKTVIIDGIDGNMLTEVLGDPEQLKLYILNILLLAGISFKELLNSLLTLFKKNYTENNKKPKIELG